MNLEAPTYNNYCLPLISIFKRLAIITSILGLAFQSSTAQDTPNILLIISDDLGVDYSNGYHEGNGLMPTTPTLDELRSTGITFENAFAAPVCSPTRAAIMSGKYGNKTGVLTVPGHLELIHESIFKALENQTSGLYSDAVIGKWHLAEGNNLDHPQEHGVDYFSGVIGGGVQDYFSWNKVVNGVSSTSTQYITSELTDDAIDWINDQDNPWFLWLAETAPHSPYHTPPADLYTINNTDNERRKYVAMIEALDHEIGRLLDNIPADDLENTVIIYIGDNGTPNNILRNYPNRHGKGSVYQGGIRVPFLVSGAGVNRSGEREAALVHVADIYATILEIAGADLPGGKFNSLSFKHLLDGTDGSTRDYNYSETLMNDTLVYAIRDNRYKLIDNTENFQQEFYDLLLDSLETNDLMGNITIGEVSAIKEDFELEALQIRNAWSCRDHIQNGDEEGIDCGGTYCAPCITETTELETRNDCFQIFPNPVKNQLQLNASNKGTYTMTINDLKGNLINKKQFSGSEFSMEINDIESGLYILELYNFQSKETCISKFIKH